jgi:hypothetical protein
VNLIVIVAALPEIDRPDRSLTNTVLRAIQASLKLGQTGSLITTQHGTPHASAN